MSHILKLLTPMRCLHAPLDEHAEKDTGASPQDSATLTFNFLLQLARHEFLVHMSQQL